MHTSSETIDSSRMRRNVQYRIKGQKRQVSHLTNNKKYSSTSTFKVRAEVDALTKFPRRDALHGCEAGCGAGREGGAPGHHLPRGKRPQRAALQQWHLPARHLAEHPRARRHTLNTHVLHLHHCNRGEGPHAHAPFQRKTVPRESASLWNCCFIERRFLSDVYCSRGRKYTIRIAYAVTLRVDEAMKRHWWLDTHRWQVRELFAF